MALAPVVGDLDEAELDRVVVEAVRLGVDAERLGPLEGSDQRVDVRGSLDPQRCAHGPGLYYRVRLTHRRAKWPGIPLEGDQLKSQDAWEGSPGGPPVWAAPRRNGCWGAEARSSSSTCPPPQASRWRRPWARMPSSRRAT